MRPLDSFHNNDLEIRKEKNVQKDMLWEEKRYPLSSSQMNIWNLEQAFRGTPMNNICETIRIRGNFDVAFVQSCLNLVLESDRTLRTELTIGEDGRLWQWEVPYACVQFPVLDFSMTNQEGILRWEESIAREVMPLLDTPLYQFMIIRIGEHEGEILVKTHHLISDGWSQVALINKIAVAYLNLIEGKAAGLEVTPSYRLHVEDEQKYLHSKMHSKDQEYWKEVLKNVSSPASLKECHSADVSPVGHRKTFYLTEIMNHALNAFCLRSRVAPFAVFYMAIAIYLKRTRGVDRFCMGAPVHNRASFTDRKTTGMFVSTLPFFSNISEEWSFEEFNSYLADQWLTLLRHQRLSYAEIFAISKEENPSVHRLYHLVLSFHNSQAYKNHNTSVEFSGQWHYSGYQAEHICIHLNNIEDEKRFLVNYDYLTQLFSEQEIENFHNYLMNILTQALAYPQRPIRELSFLGPEQEERVLFGFNRTEHFLRPISLGQKLREIWRQFPGRAAVIDKGQRFTYKTFGIYANAVARKVADYAASGDGIAVLMLPRSVLLLAAMAGCALNGTAWVIIPERSPRGRVEEILKDCTPDVILGTQSCFEQTGHELFTAPCVDLAQLLNGCDQSGEANGAAAICTNPNAMAYLIYTSGSTGKPKGVEIEQLSLLNFAENMKKYYASGAVLSICNTGFDAFLIESIVSLLNGQTIVLAGNDDVEDPSALARLIKGFGVGFITMTPSRLKAYMKNEEFCEALGRVEVIVCGGENFPGSLLASLSWHTNAKVYNQYGPSETTIGVTTALLNHASSIHAGKPMDNCRCYILDKYKNPLPTGVFGELYISGVCVGRGYHNGLAASSQAFMANPFEPGERMYYTGDIAAWTEDGSIIIKGREDGQVKLRGQRIELGEIGNSLMRCPGIEMAAARKVSWQGTDILVAYYTSKAPVLEQELMDFAASVLPEYMLPSAYMRVENIPLSANGKADVSGLPLPFPKSCEGTGIVTPGAQTILGVFQKVLKKPEMPAGGDYFMFGGDSLNALETLAGIEELLGVRLKVADLYRYRNAVRLAGAIEGKNIQPVTGQENRGLPVMTKAPALESYPLTKPQLGIYFETMMHPASHSYNMPCAFRVSGKVDRARLLHAFHQLISRETVLRTGFFQGENGICQKALDKVSAAVPVFENMSLEAAKAAFVKPFDLTCPPLMRLGLWEDQDGTVVLMDMHHIISDGETAAMLLARLSELYMDRDVPGQPFSYMDYAWWRENHGGVLEASQEKYWEALMENAPALPDIPTDFGRSAGFDYQGDIETYRISEKESRLCDEFCEKNSITLFMLFTAAFGILISSVSGQEELMIGTPVSNRHSAALKSLAGLFVNTLPLALAPKGGLACLEYLENVRTSVIGLIDHGDMPLERLASMAKRKSGAFGSPLYNTIVSLRPMVMDGAAFAGMEAVNEPVPSKSAKLDLNLEIYREKGCYHFRLEYASSLYMKSTAAFYARCIGTIAVNMARNAGERLEDIVKVSPADSFFLRNCTENASAAFADVPIDAMVDMAARMAPDQKALIFRDQVTTLGELKEKSDALACRIQELGVHQADVVGILCQRGEDLLVAMLAVLKIGCAYVPMLPSFPTKRLNYMIEISHVALTLCDGEIMKTRAEELKCQCVEIKTAVKEGAGKDYLAPVRRSGNDVCFILFTSGSTGQPKGVMIRHRSIANLYAVMSQKLESAAGGFLCTANSIFDIFITETLLTLAMGKYIVMADEDEMMLPWKCARLIQKYDVQTVEFTPSRASLFVENPEFLQSLHGMPVVLMCGEVFPPALLETLKAAGCKKIYNLYGPTEVTVYCTMDDVTDTDKITVGRIYPNCWVYVLNENMRRMMPTARGELYFGGACVSAGYVGREDLTKELFVPDPFRPGETLYKSGDIVRILPDGRIDFVGRADHQIKLNGQRVELAEIQRKLFKSGLVDQAAVIVVPDGNFKTLKAFVTALAGKTVDMKALRAYLESELPPYMVPPSIKVLERFPVTATGKTDLKALERMGGTAVPPDSAASVSGKEEALVRLETPSESGSLKGAGEASDCGKETDNCRCKENCSKETDDCERERKAAASLTPGDMEAMWREVLSVPKIDEELSFFEQGGTSLNALNLLSRYYNRGLSMTLAQFYGNPTLAGQKAFFFKTAEGQEGVLREAGPKNEKSNEAAGILEPERACRAETKPGQKGGAAVFLTGATGFFGAHILRALIDKNYEKIYCLVRGNDPKRLWDTLEWYFGRGLISGIRKKVFPVLGDIVLENFGMDMKNYELLKDETGLVIHAAADVRHYAASDNALVTNREGTRHVLAFARAAGARMVYISTVSLGSEYVKSDPGLTREFSEDDFDIGQNWEDNVYLKGKFEAERLVREAAGGGLPVKILRIGRLVGRSSDGVFQKNPESNAFWGLVSGIVQAGMVPTELSDMVLDTTAVDECAAAALLLIQKGSGMVYHLFNPEMDSVREMIETMGANIVETSREQFEDRLRSLLAAGGSVSLSMLLSQYNRLAQVPVRIRPVCRQTVECLKALGFEWKKPKLDRLLAAFLPEESGDSSAWYRRELL